MHYRREIPQILLYISIVWSQPKWVPFNAPWFYNPVVVFFRHQETLWNSAPQWQITTGAPAPQERVGHEKLDQLLTTKVTPPKTTMTIEKPPFEDVSPINNCDLPLSC